MTEEYTPTEAKTVRPHRIDITLDASGNVTAKLSCSAPVGAPCRLWCDQGCESAGKDHAEVHELTDQGHCCRTEGWFDDSPFELYDGDEAPLRSGPVILTWDGDTYNWSYDPDERAKRPDRKLMTEAAEHLRGLIDSLDEHVGHEEIAKQLEEARRMVLALEPEAREVTSNGSPRDLERERDAPTEVTDAEVEAAARVMFETPDITTTGSDYTWAIMSAEDESRADIWRADARAILVAAREVSRG